MLPSLIIGLDQRKNCQLAYLIAKIHKCGILQNQLMNMWKKNIMSFYHLIAKMQYKKHL